MKKTGDIRKIKTIRRNDLYHYICRITDVLPGNSKGFTLKGQNGTSLEIALFNVKGKFYAVSDKCQHKSGPLNKGILDEEMIITLPLAWMEVFYH